MIPGSIVLLLILSNLLLQMDCHAVQKCEWPGVLYQSMLDSHAQPNWVNEILAKLSIVSVPVRAAVASETTIPTAKPQHGWLVQPAERSFQHTGKPSKSAHRPGLENS